MSPLAGQAQQSLLYGAKPRSNYGQSRAQSGKLPYGAAGGSVQGGQYTLDNSSNVYSSPNVGPVAPGAMPAAGVRLNPRFQY